MFNRILSRLERRSELLRGRILGWRGAKIGMNFSIGRSTRILLNPGSFAADDYVAIGDFSYIDCRTSQAVRIGKYSSIDRNLWLHCGESGFFSMGNYSYIGCNAVLGAGGGGITIGHDVLIGQGVSIHSENHNFKNANQLIRKQGISYQGVVIDDDVWIGSRVVIVDGVTIEKGAVIGAGSVVTKSIPAYSVAVGVPARVIGMRSGADANSDLS